MSRFVTYTCAVCGERFTHADAKTAAHERDLHQELAHDYRAPTLAAQVARREAVMAEQGFRAGDRVTVEAATPNVPEAVLASTGIVIVNLIHGPEVISVQFPETDSMIPYAIAPSHLHAVPDDPDPLTRERFEAKAAEIAKIKRWPK